MGVHLSGSEHMACDKPNFLVIMTDQYRYPPVYEGREIREWRAENFKALGILKSRGLEFLSHYAGSTACCPSRATLYTGQYPSLHGVSQTDGAAKGAYDPDMFWLSPNTVPTLGDYFRAGGYRTYWQGKWHSSAANIPVPGTHSAFLTYDPANGEPIAANERLYGEANVLGAYGFDGWIGPEPFGANPRDSGASAAFGLSGRDVVYSRETSELIAELDRGRAASGGRWKPWLVMCSFVNPHDIALYGDITRLLPRFRFAPDPSVPYIPPAPTAAEALQAKPAAQSGYRAVYPLAFQPLADTLFYRRLYYSLLLEADRRICAVLDALMNSSFYDSTIVIFTSDHGELLGAHGGLFQKWYQAYEETIHVPLIIHNPLLFAKGGTTSMLTSHVDILPTMLGLAGLDAGGIREQLRESHTEACPFAGRDLSPVIRSGCGIEGSGGPVYFMTDDNITSGLNQFSVTGLPYCSVMQPNSVETVIATLPSGAAGRMQTWKYSRYFDNPRFWSALGRREQFTCAGRAAAPYGSGFYGAQEAARPAPDQYEMYNLSEDPLETDNLACPGHAGESLPQIRAALDGLLWEQRGKKRIYPGSGAQIC